MSIRMKCMLSLLVTGGIALYGSYKIEEKLCRILSGNDEEYERLKKENAELKKKQNNK